MDKNGEMYLIANSKNLPTDKIMYLKSRLDEMDDNKFSTLHTVPLKDPTLAIILSVLVGTLGVDRFYIGDIGLGIGKLITCGGCGIWTIIDWFIIMKATKKKNFEKIQPLL